MIGFKEMLEFKESLERRVEALSVKLSVYPRNADGRVPKVDRLSKSYAFDKNQYRKAFKDLQYFNNFFVRYYKDEYREHMQRGKNEF